MKVIDTLWFTPAPPALRASGHPSGIVGIVLVEYEVGDDHGDACEHGAYIGVGHGISQGQDAEVILNWGARLHAFHARILMNHLRKGRLKMNPDKLRLLDGEGVSEEDFPEYPYLGPNGRDAHCHLRVRWKGDTALVCWTEHNDNPGMSVTNAAEVLATRVVNDFCLDPSKCLFIEHYKYEHGISRETWCMVTFGPWEKRGEDLLLPTERAKFDPLDDDEAKQLMSRFQGGKENEKSPEPAV